MSIFHSIRLWNVLSQASFKKIIDFGELWKSRFGDLPLPLGLDVVRKDVGEVLAHTLSAGVFITDIRINQKQFRTHCSMDAESTSLLENAL